MSNQSKVAAVFQRLVAIDALVHAGVEGADKTLGALILANKEAFEALVNMGILQVEKVDENHFRMGFTALGDALAREYGANIH